MNETTGDSSWIVGVWRLVHSRTIKPNGDFEYPLGADAIGYIYYSASGVMAVQISRKERPAAAASADEPINKHYLAYFGRYEVDSDTEIVRHFVEGQLLPNAFADQLERRYKLSGDTMLLTPVDNGSHEILWRKA